MLAASGPRRNGLMNGGRSRNSSDFEKLLCFSGLGNNQVVASSRVEEHVCGKGSVITHRWNIGKRYYFFLKRLSESHFCKGVRRDALSCARR